MSKFNLNTLDEIESWMEAFDVKFSASGDKPVSQKAASFMADAIAVLAREVRLLKDKINDNCIDSN